MSKTTKVSIMIFSSFANKSDQPIESLGIKEDEEEEEEELPVNTTKSGFSAARRRCTK